MHVRLEAAGPTRPPLTRSHARTLRAHAAYLSALFACLSFTAAPTHAQTPADPNLLRVQVLSGKTGRPLTNTRFQLWRTVKAQLTLDGAKTNPGETTDGEGYATIPPTDATTFFLHVDLHMPCSKDVPAFSLMDIRARGVVSQNTCSKHIHMFPQPGTLIFFVRDETFFEKMRH